MVKSLKKMALDHQETEIEKKVTGYLNTLYKYHEYYTFWTNTTSCYPIIF